MDQNRKLLQDLGKLDGVGMAGLQLIETLKANGSESDFFAKWSGYQAKALNAEQEIGVSTQFLAAIPSFLTTLTNTVVLVLGGFLIFKGENDHRDAGGFSKPDVKFSQPVTGLVSLGSQLQEMEGDMNRIDDVLKYPVDEQVKEDVQGADSNNSFKN